MNKLTNKGQALVIFIIFIPLILMIGTLVIDLGIAKYNDYRLEEITKDVLSYGLKHIDNNPYNNMVDLLYQNDDSIDNYSIEVNQDEKTIRISVDKATKGFFGSMVGKEIYKEKSSYVGYFSGDKIVIEKGR